MNDQEVSCLNSLIGQTEYGPIRGHKPSIKRWWNPVAKYWLWKMIFYVKADLWPEWDEVHFLSFTTLARDIETFSAAVEYLPPAFVSSWEEE